MRKVLLMLLILILSMSMIPSAFAEDTVSPQEEVTRVREEVDLRETNADTYLLSDGSYECVVYADDKYYIDDKGEYTEIDNSIVNEEHAVSDRIYDFANKANSNKMHFSDSTPAVLIESKEKSLSFEMLGSLDTNAIVGGDKTTEPISDFELSGNNRISYPDVQNQTDLVYEVRNGLLKEYIILKGLDAPTEYSFIFDSGYRFEKTDEGTINVYDENSETVFELGRLFAVDSADNYTEDLEYTITEEGNITIVTVSISTDYLYAPERAFPVLIDPTTMITGETATFDSYVSSNHTSTNYYTSTYLKTGRSEDYHIRRSYIKFDIPSTVKNGWITASTLRLKKRGGIAPATVKARRVTSAWTSSGVTWSNKPDTATTGFVFSLDSDNWYYANVRNIVRKWAHEGKVNRGFELKDETESGTDHWTNFYSSDADSPNKPELHITYVNVGTRPYQAASGIAANCMGYALEYKWYIGEVELGIVKADLSGKTTAQMLTYINTKARYWMIAHIGSSDYETISAYDSAINTSSPGWFRVVMRVGFIDANSNGVYDVHENYDYHWWYQTNENNGEWADKLASLSSSR